MKPGVTSIYVVTATSNGPLFEPAVAAGAEVVHGLRDEDYDSPGFTARDPEGTLWTFGLTEGLERLDAPWQRRVDWDFHAWDLGCTSIRVSWRGHWARWQAGQIWAGSGGLPGRAVVPRNNSRGRKRMPQVAVMVPSGWASLPRWVSRSPIERRYQGIRRPARAPGTGGGRLAVPPWGPGGVRAGRPGSARDQWPGRSRRG